jgi:hypothetical protein
VNDAAYITQQPGNKVVCLGGSVPLNIVYNGGTSNTYLPSVTDPGTKYYYCIVSFQSGLCKNVVSHTATVQVNDAAYITQ